MLIRRLSRLAAARSTALAPLAFGALAALLIAGCSVNHTPRFEYGPEGEKTQFKRYEKYLALDYIHHFTGVVYERTDAVPLGPTLSDTQTTLLEKKGKPDYVRTDYLSDSNERVTDWIYFEKDALYQFVEGEVVYEAPLDDYDKILIRRGRPTRVTLPEDRPGHRSEVLQYRKPFSTQNDDYVFDDGKLSGMLLN